MPRYQAITAACFCLLATTPLSAQIYESKDADGNPVFSDTPTPGAAKVELQDSNVAKSVPVPPPSAPAPAKRPQSKSPTAAEVVPDLEGDRLIVTDGDDKKRRKLSDAIPRPEPREGVAEKKAAGGGNATRTVRPGGGGRR